MQKSYTNEHLPSRVKPSVSSNLGKLVKKRLAENSPAENSSQEQMIISGKYGSNFVIIPCYEVLNYGIMEYCTVNYKSETFQAII